MLKKLRIKFICVNMLIVTVMLAVILGMIMHFTQDNLENRSIQTLHQISGRPVKPGLPHEIPQTGCFLLQINPRGELVASGDIASFDGDSSVLQAIFNSAVESDGEIGVLEEYSLRYLRTKTSGGLSIAFTDITLEIATLRALTYISIFTAGISFLLFLGISILLAGWAVKPVEASWNQQRQFIADASHELKTPLTVIMTNAELLASPDYSDTEKSRFTNNILTTSREMRRLAESMLELARADNGAIRSHFEPVDLGQLVSDALLPFEPVFYEQGLQLESDIESGAMISGNSAYLLQLTDILLDNARKYSAPSGTVQINLHRIGKNVRLTVANPCDEISKEDLKNIFTRFYRIDKARTRSGSYGLGLSIAHTIANEHNGQINAQWRDGVIQFITDIPAI